MPESLYNIQNFIHLARPSVANYVQNFIFRVIMNSNPHTREQEGIRSSQGSESFQLQMCSSMLRIMPIIHIQQGMFSVAEHMYSSELCGNKHPIGANYNSNGKVNFVSLTREE
eukprot:scaffold506906_cov149-Attheya_sp.AAC.1